MSKRELYPQITRISEDNAAQPKSLGCHDRLTSCFLYKKTDPRARHQHEIFRGYCPFVLIRVLSWIVPLWLRQKPRCNL
jgi:hypothetical protein